jgi:peptidoglycan/xylan/chitin deacetylase (PgdA/CDA1 family)
MARIVRLFDREPQRHRRAGLALGGDMNKRLLLARVLDTLGATRLVLGLRRAIDVPWLPVVTFHRVLERGDHAAFLLDDGVVDAAPDEFERHVQTIRRYFQPIGIAELIAAFDGEPLPKRPIVVTFDDGYRDNVEVALPILKRHDVKAVFFVATEYISRRRVFWWDRVNYIIKRSTCRAIELRYPTELALSLATPLRRQQTVQTVLRLLKTHVHLELEPFLEQLAAAADVRWTPQIERELAESAVMTWDQVRELDRAGMDVQSHTRTHRVLQTLAPTQLREELRGSRDDLECELDAPVTSIAYPVGLRLEDDRTDVRRALVEAGYRIGFSNATGTHHLRAGGDPYNISRMGLDLGTTDALFRATLAFPRVFDRSGSQAPVVRHDQACTALRETDDSSAIAGTPRSEHQIDDVAPVRAVPAAGTGDLG